MFLVRVTLESSPPLQPKPEGDNGEQDSSPSLPDPQASDEENLAQLESWIEDFHGLAKEALAGSVTRRQRMGGDIAAGI